ncbi:MAG: hypothetical protein IIC10_03405 [Proteobacteria bacterium]|nr:hypothetical protein [Pseudomonadota bacterium]
MSLVARHLEGNGIPTVVIGSALDVVEHCGVPRYLHSDFPLGNPCGKPYDVAMQDEIIRQALSLLESAEGANTVARTPFTWGEDCSWRDDYARIDDGNREALRLRGEARRQRQAQDKADGKLRVAMVSET